MEKKKDHDYACSIYAHQIFYKKKKRKKKNIYMPINKAFIFY